MSAKNFGILIQLFFILALLCIACTPAPQTDASAQITADIPKEASISNLDSLGYCYNPFNPVIEGKRWNYLLKTQEETQSFDVYYQEVNKDRFTRLVEFPDFHSETSWTCSPEGLLSMQFGTLTSKGLGDFGIQPTEVRGVSIPKAELWKIGYAWQTQYIAEVKLGMGDNEISGQGNITQNYTIVGREPITVPAGMYDSAYIVDTSINIIVDFFGSQTSIETTSKDWYVENIGLVKSQSDDPEYPYILELVSIQ